MPNINDFDRLYRRTKTGKGELGSVVEIRLDPVPSGTLRVLSHVTAENLDHSCTIVRLAIFHSGQKLYIDELLTVAAAELCVSRSDIILGEGDYFLVEFTGTTTGNNLILNAIGWENAL